jgi:hypothetical protein
MYSMYSSNCVSSYLCCHVRLVAFSGAHHVSIVWLASGMSLSVPAGMEENNTSAEKMRLLRLWNVARVHVL